MIRQFAIPAPLVACRRSIDRVKAASARSPAGVR
jgi:hypothetical protein